MKLRRLEVKHFRGLESFAWDPGPGLNILIGAGDSCKTTVLDAIDLALGPRWNPAFTDADFTHSDTTQDIIITATVGDLPKEILGDSRFQDHFRGWRDGELHDEPSDDENAQDEPVLSIRLTVTSSLEPSWTVWTERQTEPGPTILGRDRERLGVVRVGSYVDRHMGWGRGSALAQFGDSIDDLTPVFADVRRKSREAFKETELPQLKETSSSLGAKARDMGVRISEGLAPGLDFGAIRDGATSVSLYDGEVPTKQMGLGSKRLLTIAMQLGRQADQHLLLVDEIESALEPYRIRHLMRTIIETNVQAVATTHSPVVLQESSSQNVTQMSRSGGVVKAFPADSTLKDLLKSFPSALLARRVVCCEGNTEYQCLRSLVEIWRDRGHGDLAIVGVETVDCGGASEVGKTARAFLSHNIPLAIFADSDQPINLPKEVESNPLLRLVQQDNSQSFEQALSASLDDACQDLILEKMAELLGGEGNLRAQLLEAFDGLPGTVRTAQLTSPKSGSASASASIADVSTRLKWFKAGDRCYHLMKALSPKWDSLLQTEFGQKLEALREWCYAE